MGSAAASRTSSSWNPARLTWLFSCTTWCPSLILQHWWGALQLFPWLTFGNLHQILCSSQCHGLARREMQALCRPEGHKSSFISSDKWRSTKRIVSFTFGCLQIIIYLLKASHSTFRCGIVHREGLTSLCLFSSPFPLPPLPGHLPEELGKVSTQPCWIPWNIGKKTWEFSWFSPNFLPSCPPQLCYLYTDLYKQTNSKETRRVFLEFYQFFLDRAAVGSTCFLHFHKRPASWLWPFSTHLNCKKLRGLKPSQINSFKNNNWDNI